MCALRGGGCIICVCRRTLFFVSRPCAYKLQQSHHTSGAEVRDRTLELARKTKVKWALGMIGRMIASKREFIEYLVKTSGTRPKRGDGLMLRSSHSRL